VGAEAKVVEGYSGLKEPYSNIPLLSMICKQTRMRGMWDHLLPLTPATRREARH
jgi:hypothetical protein